MLLYALSIFTSAFLLFLLQPIIAKEILPWFGGSAAVWTTCLVFFQFLLFAGYAYSDLTTRHLAPRRQVTLHGVLLLASLAALPIIPAVGWKPDGTEDPVWRILGLLAATVGLPYFLLSTTGPLVQAWFARTFHAGLVYRLFALSNFASLLALLSYPFLIEPRLQTRVQAWIWSSGYGVFAVLCMAAAVYSLRPRGGVPAAKAFGAVDAGSTPGPWEHATWLLFAAMGTFMLLAVTNRLTQDLASVPFLWILPLTLYLLTFILCFEGHGWYRRSIFLWLLLASVGAMAWKLNAGTMMAAVGIPLNLAGLFVMCMFFHGELAARKPEPHHLTRFYLMVSLGGALGGLAVAVVAVRIFHANYEFGLGLAATLLIAAFVVRRLHPVVPLATLVAVSVSAYLIHQHINQLGRDTRLMTRNFYGALRVKEVDVSRPNDARLRLLHGITIHGEQYLAPERRREATTYYGPTSGIGRTLAALAGRARRVGVVGLGAGTLATYGQGGDVFRFYDIDPQVVDVAKHQFSFLADSPARIETVLGDARLAMEGEAPQDYDVLAIDAFSSDSIPVHLMTREAMAVYLRHMKPGGVIAFHVSNRHLRLAPVVKRIAGERGLSVALVQDEPADAHLMRSDWVLVARNGILSNHALIATAVRPIEDISGLEVWTDDFNNLFRILK